MRRIEASPFVTKHESLRGFVFDVATGKLERGHGLTWSPACGPGSR